MKKVSDILKEVSFFNTMETEQTDLYNETIGMMGYSNSSLDISLMLEFGMRTPTDLLINYTLKNAVNFICEKYGNKWLKSYEAIALEYDILNPYSNKVERITDSKSNNVDMSTSTDTDKIYGFDSDEGVNKDSSSNNAERTNDGETNTNETIIRTGNNGNTSMMVNSALQLAKNNLWSIILNDIKDELSLDIY